MNRHPVSVLVSSTDSSLCSCVAELLADSGEPTASQCLPGPNALLDHLKLLGDYPAPGAQAGVVVLDASGPADLEALEAIRQHPKYHMTPVIVLAHRSRLSEAYRRGANSVLPRPFREELLKEMMQVWLSIGERRASQHDLLAAA